MLTGPVARQKGSVHGPPPPLRTHSTSSTRSVRTGAPLISRMRSPGWMALRLSGLMCIRLTLGQTREGGAEEPSGGLTHLTGAGRAHQALGPGRPPRPRPLRERPHPISVKGIPLTQRPKPEA